MQQEHRGKRNRKTWRRETARRPSRRAAPSDETTTAGGTPGDGVVRNNNARGKVGGGIQCGDGTVTQVFSKDGPPGRA
jgi:hypothetical protein